MTTRRSRTRRAVVACASFKGTLSSLQAGRAVAKGLRAHGLSCDIVALADGGEGLVEALARAVPGAKLFSTRCRGPLGEKHAARWALLPKGPGRSAPTAVIEMAASSGLPLVPESKRDPCITTTWGVGDQIRAALDKGAGAILLGIGGSATNDAGAGMAQALGARLLDAHGKELSPGGAALGSLSKIDLSRMDKRLRMVDVTVACDVENPLCGPRGASAVYGPQKGATPAKVKILDAALERFAHVVLRDLRKQVRKVPGAGAAGGLGAGSIAFLNARLTPGIDLVLQAVGFDARIKGAAFAVTGEGKLDRQTLMGKAPAGVAKRARMAGVSCVAIGGGIESRALPALKRVFVSTESLSDFAGSSKKAQTRAAYWLEKLARTQGSKWLTCAGKFCGAED